MAKVTSPLMSLDASGSIAGAITFSKWKGRNYVRQLVIPANPRTAGQQAARAAVGAGGRMTSFMEKESPAQVALNEDAPSGQSGAGYWVKLQSQKFEQSETDYSNVTYADEKGYFDAAAATLGISPITIPGDTPVIVPAGLILWNGYDAMNAVDPTLAPTRANTASEANITTFVNSLSA